MTSDSTRDDAHLLVPLRGAHPEAASARWSELPRGRVAGAPVAEATDETKWALRAFDNPPAVATWRSPARWIHVPTTAVPELAARAGASSVLIASDDGTVSERPAARAPDSIPALPFDVRALAGPLEPEALARLRLALEEALEPMRAYVAEATVDGSPVLVAGLEWERSSSLIADRVRDELLSLPPVRFYRGVQIVAMTDPYLSAALRAVDKPIYER